MSFTTEQKLYTTPDAAEFLGLQANTVRKLVQRELLTPFQKIGQSYLFVESELKRYREEKSPPGNPEFVRRRA